MIFVILAFIPIAFYFGLLVERAICRKKGKTLTRRRLANQNIIDLIHHKTTLTEIREGRMENAVEFLEFSLDLKVSGLWHDQSKVDDYTRSEIIQFLGYVKTYRQRWPRKVQVFANENLSMPERQESADEVAKILLSYENERNKSG